jgi:hypothetical protein
MAACPAARSAQIRRTERSDGSRATITAAQSTPVATYQGELQPTGTTK